MVHTTTEGITLLKRSWHDTPAAVQSRAPSGDLICVYAARVPFIDTEGVVDGHGRAMHCTKPSGSSTLTSVVAISERHERTRPMKPHHPVAHPLAPTTFPVATAKRGGWFVSRCLIDATKKSR